MAFEGDRESEEVLRLLELVLTLGGVISNVYCELNGILGILF